MPKAHTHLLLPPNQWTKPGFSWCLRFSDASTVRLLPVTHLVQQTTCPLCLSLFASAQDEPLHPLREYSLLDQQRQAVTLTTPASVARYCRHLVQEPQEVVICLMATVTLRLVHTRELFRGTLEESLLHPREIFRAVLEQNAYGFVLVHNHPSGEVEPSEDDKRVTRQLLQCSQLLKIPFLDHVIVARQGFYSLRERTTLWDEV